MKIYLAIFSVLIFFHSLSESESAGNSIPQTVDEALKELKTSWFSDEDLDWILRNPKEHVEAELHLPFGTQVRNEWKLWADNSALLESCGVSHAEDCSGIIFGKLWDSERKDADPNLVKQLDCQFQLVSLIRIRYKGYYKHKIGEILKDVKKQINDQHIDAGLQLRNDCGFNLKLKVQGDPSLNCWSRVEFSEDGRDPVSLDLFLGWISWRNGFDIRHSPPNIDLVFYKRCTWPEFPEHFSPRKSKKLMGE